MTDRNGAAVGVHVLRIVAEAQRARASQGLSREGFIQLHHVEIADLQAELFHQLLRRRHRAEAHDARRHAGGRHAGDFRERRETISLHRLA